MTHPIFISAKIKLPEEDKKKLLEFVQGIVNRRTVGYLRYGPNSRHQRFMSRLAEELKAYRKTGNMEHLFNIAVYAYLESDKPENKRFHYEPRAESATRIKFGV
jgi:hypothetical protein